MIVGMSQLSGLVSDMIDAVISGFDAVFGSILAAIVLSIMTWFYGVFIAFANILDVIQMLFRKLAGLETYIIRGVQTSEPRDLALELINNQTVMNIFWSMLILGAVLLFITTFIAVIKSEYQPLEQRFANSKGKVIAKSLKSVALMITVPVAAFFGIIIGNALLKSIDSATSFSSDANLSSRIFVASAYNANKAREGVDSFDQAFLDSLKTKNNFGLFVESSSGYIVETVADKIDRAFRDNAVPLGSDYDNDFEDYPTSFSIYNIRLVAFYYNVLDFNLIIALGVTIMMITILMQTLMALIKRLYAVVLLFVISPPIMALTPVNEDAYKAWKKEFIKSVLMAYSVIVVMNIYIMLIPVLGSIQFFTPTDEMHGMVLLDTSMNFLNLLAQLLILVAGAVFFKDFSGTLANIIGGDNALSKDNLGANKEFLGTTSKAMSIGKSLASPIGALAKWPINSVRNDMQADKATRQVYSDAYKKSRNEGEDRIFAAWEAQKEQNKAIRQYKRSHGMSPLNNFFLPKDSSGNPVGFIKDKINRVTSSNLYKKIGAEDLFTPGAGKLKEKQGKIREKQYQELTISDLRERQKERQAARDAKTRESSEKTAAEDELIRKVDEILKNTNNSNNNRSK